MPIPDDGFPGGTWPAVDSAAVHLVAKGGVARSRISSGDGETFEAVLLPTPRIHPDAGGDGLADRHAIRVAWFNGAAATGVARSGGARDDLFVAGRGGDTLRAADCDNRLIGTGGDDLLTAGAQRRVTAAGAPSLDVTDLLVL